MSLQDDHVRPTLGVENGRGGVHRGRKESALKKGKGEEAGSQLSGDRDQKRGSPVRGSDICRELAEQKVEWGKWGLDAAPVGEEKAGSDKERNRSNLRTEGKSKSKRRRGNLMVKNN